MNTQSLPSLPHQKDLKCWSLNFWKHLLFLVSRMPHSRLTLSSSCLLGGSFCLICRFLLLSLTSKCWSTPELDPATTSLFLAVLFQSGFVALKTNYMLLTPKAVPAAYPLNRRTTQPASTWHPHLQAQLVQLWAEATPPHPLASTLSSTSTNGNSTLAVAQAKNLGAAFDSFLVYSTPSGPSSGPVTLTSKYTLNSVPSQHFLYHPPGPKLHHRLLVWLPQTLTQTACSCRGSSALSNRVVLFKPKSDQSCHFYSKNPQMVLPQPQGPMRPYMKIFPLAPLLHLQLLSIPGFLQSSHTSPLDVPGMCHMHSHFGPLHLLFCPLAVRFHPYKCTASSLPSLKSLFKSYLI